MNTACVSSGCIHTCSWKSRSPDRMSCCCGNRQQIKSHSCMNTEHVCTHEDSLLFDSQCARLADPASKASELPIKSAWLMDDPAFPSIRSAHRTDERAALRCSGSSRHAFFACAERLFTFSDSCALFGQTMTRGETRQAALWKFQCFCRAPLTEPQSSHIHVVIIISVYPFRTR